jgi:hypothetical protein
MKMSLEEAYRFFCLGEREKDDLKSPSLPDQAPPRPAPQPVPGSQDNCE